MSLADAAALSFLMPVFTAIILAVWMREHMTGPRMTALALGLFGRPGRDRFPQSFVRGAALALAAAALFGVLSYVP